MRLSDTALLVPAFWERLESALRALKGQGYHPLVWETLRSRARAEQLAAKGTGVADSMHLYGVAADVICGVHQWDCRRHHCGFFEAFGAAAEDAGLTWGGRWRRVDLPHVQAVPVRLQTALRRLPEGERDAFVRKALRAA